MRMQNINHPKTSRSSDISPGRHDGAKKGFEILPLQTLPSKKVRMVVRPSQRMNFRSEDCLGGRQAWYLFVGSGPWQPRSPGRFLVRRKEINQQPRWQPSHNSPSLPTMVVQPWVAKWAQGLSAMAIKEEGVGGKMIWFGGRFDKISSEPEVAEY